MCLLCVHVYFLIGSLANLQLVQLVLRAVCSQYFGSGASRCVALSTEGLYCLLKPTNDLRCVRIKEDGTHTRVFSDWFNGGFSNGSIGSIMGSVQYELWIWSIGAAGVFPFQQNLFYTWCLLGQGLRTHAQVRARSVRN